MMVDEGEKGRWIELGLVEIGVASGGRGGYALVSPDSCGILRSRLNIVHLCHYLLTNEFNETDSLVALVVPHWARGLPR